MNDLKSRLKTFYDEEGLSDYQADRYTEGNFFANRIKDRLTSLIKKKISNSNYYDLIDIGSAEGMFVREINNRKGISLCVDLSYPKLQRGLQYAVGLEGVYFINADSEDLPLKKNIFNGVISSEVLEHLPNPEKAIKEINFILKTGGTLFLSVPTGKDRFRPLDDTKVSDNMTESGHLHEFSKKEIKQLLKGNGFHVKEVITIDVLGEVRSFFTKFLKNVVRIIRKKNKTTKSSIISKSCQETPKSHSKKRFLNKLYMKSWGGLDIFLSNIPFIKNKGHFAIFVAKKISNIPF